MASREEVLEEVGRALRIARRARGLTLRDVGTRSQGQFKPTAVAGYERAERAVSLERFCALAQLYGMGPERLLSQIMWRIRGGPEPTIDRGRLREVPAHEADKVSDFIEGVRRLLADGGIRVIQTPRQAPNANAYAEGFVRSIKQECLDRMLPLGERHFRRIVTEFVEHYHGERNHQGLGNRLIESRGPARVEGRIRRRVRLGGLLNYYERAA